jgi:hypothetical protein
MSDDSTREDLESQRRTLERLERRYREGEKLALPKLVAFCLAKEMKIPVWARRDFVRACLFGHGPWENDFGNRPKRKNLGKLVVRARKAEAIFDRVEELRKEYPVDAALFERVAEEFHVSAGTVSADYYSDRTRGAICDRNADREINQLMDKEIGPNWREDSDAMGLWYERNSDRVAEIEDRWFDWYQNPPRTRKSGKPISKKSDEKI